MAHDWVNYTCWVLLWLLSGIDTYLLIGALVQRDRFMTVWWCGCLAMLAHDIWKGYVGLF